MIQLSGFQVYSHVFTGVINTTDTIVWPLDIMNETIVKSVRITYDIQYEEYLCHTCQPGVDNQCCPHIIFYSGDRYKRAGRNESCELKLSYLSVPSVLNIWNTPLNVGKDSTSYNKCVLDDNMVRCKRTILLSQGYHRSIVFTFAACHSSVGLKLHYKVSLEHITNITKEKSIIQNYCPGYKYVSFPGMFGFSNQKDFIDFSNSVTGMTIRNFVETCYQHGWLFMCRVSVPEYASGQQILPCQEFCQEFAESCKDSFPKTGTVLGCGNLQTISNSDSVCFHRKVSCLKPDAPQHGEVSVSSTELNGEAVFKCYFGYKLLGTNKSICRGTGKWSPATPTCEANYKTTVIIACSTLCGLIIISVICIIIIARKKGLLKKWKKKYTIKTSPPSFKYDAFISYSSGDADFIEGEFREKVEEERNPPFNLCIHGRDFLAGPTIHENIINAIIASRMTLIMLSRAFLRSPWCQHEFSVAFHRMVDEGLPYSSVVMVFLEDIPRHELPTEIQAYCYTCTYIERSHAHFWDQIYNVINKAKEDYSETEPSSI